MAADSVAVLDRDQCVDGQREHGAIVWHTDVCVGIGFSQCHARPGAGNAASLVVDGGACHAIACQRIILDRVEPVRPRLNHLPTLRQIFGMVVRRASPVLVFAR